MRPRGVKGKGGAGADLERVLSVAAAPPLASSPIEPERSGQTREPEGHQEQERGVAKSAKFFQQRRRHSDACRHPVAKRAGNERIAVLLPAGMDCSPGNAVENGLRCEKSIPVRRAVRQRNMSESTLDRHVHRMSMDDGDSRGRMEEDTDRMSDEKRQGHHSLNSGSPGPCSQSSGSAGSTVPAAICGSWHPQTPPTEALSSARAARLALGYVQHGFGSFGEELHSARIASSELTVINKLIENGATSPRLASLEYREHLGKVLEDAPAGLLVAFDDAVGQRSEPKKVKTGPGGSCLKPTSKSMFPAEAMCVGRSLDCNFKHDHASESDTAMYEFVQVYSHHVHSGALTDRVWRPGMQRVSMRIAHKLDPITVHGKGTSLALGHSESRVLLKDEAGTSAMQGAVPVRPAGFNSHESSLFPSVSPMVSRSFRRSRSLDEQDHSCHYALSPSAVTDVGTLSIDRRLGNEVPQRRLQKGNNLDTGQKDVVVSRLNRQFELSASSRHASDEPQVDFTPTVLPISPLSHRLPASSISSMASQILPKRTSSVDKVSSPDHAIKETSHCQIPHPAAAARKWQQPSDRPVAKQQPDARNEKQMATVSLGWDLSDNSMKPALAGSNQPDERNLSPLRCSKKADGFYAFEERRVPSALLSPLFRSNSDWSLWDRPETWDRPDTKFGSKTPKGATFYEPTVRGSLIGLHAQIAAHCQSLNGTQCTR